MVKFMVIFGYLGCPDCGLQVVVIWRLLQKYAVVPNSWSAFVARNATTSRWNVEFKWISLLGGDLVVISWSLFGC